jgi:predicted nucleotidyltransferase
MEALMTRQEAIRELTRRMVEHYQPERVYLFGSAARGDDSKDSDLDFLVVVPDDAPPERKRTAEFQMRRLDIREAVDLVIVRHSYFEKHRTARTGLPFAAMNEGKILYERQAA